jgi:hypothetical protein
VAALQQRPAQVTTTAASQQQQQQQQQQQDEERVQASSLKLTLQLLAPLLPQHSMQLVQTQGFTGLSVVKTPTWLDPLTRHRQVLLSQQHDSQGMQQDTPFGRAGVRWQMPHPVLPCAVLQQLKGLPGLNSLGCDIGQPGYKEKLGEVSLWTLCVCVPGGGGVLKGGNLRVGPQHFKFAALDGQLAGNSQRTWGPPLCMRAKVGRGGVFQGTNLSAGPEHLKVQQWTARLQGEAKGGRSPDFQACRPGGGGALRVRVPRGRGRGWGVGEGSAVLVLQMVLLQ